MSHMACFLFCTLPQTSIITRARAPSGWPSGFAPPPLLSRRTDTQLLSPHRRARALTCPHLQPSQPNQHRRARAYTPDHWSCFEARRAREQTERPDNSKTQQKFRIFSIKISPRFKSPARALWSTTRALITSAFLPSSCIRCRQKVRFLLQPGIFVMRGWDADEGSRSCPVEVMEMLSDYSFVVFSSSSFSSSVALQLVTCREAEKLRLSPESTLLTVQCDSRSRRSTNARALCQRLSFPLRPHFHSFLHFHDVTPRGSFIDESGVNSIFLRYSLKKWVNIPDSNSLYFRAMMINQFIYELISTPTIYQIDVWDKLLIHSTFTFIKLFLNEINRL